MASQRKRLIIMQTKSALHVWVTRPGEEPWPLLPGLEVPNWIDCRSAMALSYVAGGLGPSPEGVVVSF